MNTYSIQDVFDFIRAQDPKRCVNARDSHHEEEGSVLCHFAKCKKRGLGLGGRIYNDSNSLSCSERQWEEKEKSGFMARLAAATISHSLYRYGKIQKFLKDWETESAVGIA